MYLGSVQALHLSATHAVVQSEGRIISHPLEMPATSGHSVDDFDQVVPEAGQSPNVTCSALAHPLVITGSSQGTCHGIVCAAIECLAIFTAFSTLLYLYLLSECIRYKQT